MHKLFISLIVAIGLSTTSSAQIPNGSIAPDFVLTDLDGNSHHLYEYLANGKVVFIKFFACHCPSCWSYFNTGKLESLYNTYGPPGTDQIMILMIEHDEYNGYNEFHGLSPNTQGDWVTGNPIPIIDCEFPDRGVFTDYNMTYYPMIFKICPDKTVELMSTSLAVADLYQKAEDCPGALSITESLDNKNVKVDYENRQIILDDFEGITDVEILNGVGSRVLQERSNVNKKVDISGLSLGVYFIKIVFNEGAVIRKIYIP